MENANLLIKDLWSIYGVANDKIIVSPSSCGGNGIFLTSDVKQNENVFIENPILPLTHPVISPENSSFIEHFVSFIIQLFLMKISFCSSSNLVRSLTNPFLSLNNHVFVR